ncbi:MAG: hypothetical protein AAGL90_08000 [Pseudomonadota bacterium]
MTAPDPIVPKLLDLKHQDQVQRLAAIMTELRLVTEKRTALDAEFIKMDASETAATRLSVQNGYLRYMQHRRDALDTQIKALQAQAHELQNALRQTVFSRSVLDEDAAP